MMAVVCCQLLPIVMAFTVVLLKLICDASLLTVPRNSVAVIGKRVELRCSADVNQHVIWGFTSFNTSKDTNIYFGNDISLPFQSRYKIDKRISGQHNMVIDSVDLDYAGRYHCVTIATGNKTVAHLTVLGRGVTEIYIQTVKMADELQTFVQSLTNERPSNVGVKERELVKVREKIRKIRARDRKQKQRMRELMASLRETANELVVLKSEAVRIRSEIRALDDDVAD